MAPVGQLEVSLVDLITAGFWRLRRTGKIESEVFDNLREDLAAERFENSPDLMLVTLPGPATNQVKIGLNLKRLLERYLKEQNNPEVAATLAQVEQTIEYYKTHPATVHIPSLRKYMQYFLSDISVDLDYLTDQDRADLEYAIKELSEIEAEI